MAPTVRSDLGPGIPPSISLGAIPRGSGGDAERSVGQIAEGVKPINEELKKEKPDARRLNAAVRALAQQPGTIPASNLNKKIAEINAIIARLDDGKAVFFKDIGKEFLDPSGGLSGEIMPDYLHLSRKGYEIWAEAMGPTLARMMQ